MLTKFCSEPSENDWRRGFYIIVWQQANSTSGDPSVMLTLLRICTSHRVDERPSAPRAYRNCVNFIWLQGEVWQMKPMSAIVGYHFAQPSVDNKWDRCPVDVTHGVDGAKPKKATIVSVDIVR